MHGYIHAFLTRKTLNSSTVRLSKKVNYIIFVAVIPSSFNSVVLILHADNVLKCARV